MDFLQSGNQTQITPKIQKISDRLEGTAFNYTANVLLWIEQNIKTQRNHPDKGKLLRTRTADQIISDGFATGCTDIALVFIVLTRAKGLPTKYVEAIKESWLQRGSENSLEGHVFAEVEIDDNWYQVDPDMLTIKLYRSYKGFQIYEKGLDSWDLGIDSFEKLKEVFLEFRSLHAQKYFSR